MAKPYVPIQSCTAENALSMTAEDASKGKRKIDDFFTKKPADASVAEESSASVNGKGKASASAAAAKSSKKKKEEASEEEDDEEEDDDEDEDGEGSDDGEGGSDDDDDDDDDNDEDRAPKSKKRRTKGSDESGSDSESDPEVKLNEDDFIGLDTSNIIPRARRRAAVAAMAKPMELPAGANKGGHDDDESSDEAEF